MVRGSHVDDHDRLVLLAVLLIGAMCAIGFAANPTKATARRLIPFVLIMGLVFYAIHLLPWGRLVGPWSGL